MGELDGVPLGAVEVEGEIEGVELGKADAVGLDVGI